MSNRVIVRAALRWVLLGVSGLSVLSVVAPSTFAVVLQALVAYAILRWLCRRLCRWFMHRV